MSIAYRMDVSITEFHTERVDQIVAAAGTEWQFGPLWLERDEEDRPQKILLDGESVLAGGETEEEFCRRLSSAIWKANGGYCVVDINATCLEDLPYTNHCLDQDEYEAIANEEDAP